MSVAHARRVGAARAHDHVLAGARRVVGRQHFAQAEADYATVANAIAAFEPVLMAADPRQAAEARRLCGAGVESSSCRSTTRGRATRARSSSATSDGGRAGVQFGFNGWGEKFVPYDEDAQFATRVLAQLGVARRDAAHFVLEGGSISVDGAGTLVTTEQCLFEEHRNPQLSREQIEAELRRAAGRRAGRLARARAGRGPRHRRARRQHLRVHRAGPGRAPDRARRGEPELRELPGEPAPAARRGDRGDRAAVAAVPRMTRTGRASSRTRTSTSATAG